MDEPTTMLTARVPITLIARITNLAIDTNRTRTQVILDALAAYITVAKCRDEIEKEQEQTK